MPITWQNVNAPSNAEAVRGFAAAQLGIGNAFDKLGGLITDREAVNQKTADRTDDAAVQRMLDTIHGAATPEALAALRQSGQLDQMRAALNPALLAKVRGAEDARLASIQQQTGVNNAFTISQIKQPMLEADAQAAVGRAPVLRQTADTVAKNAAVAATQTGVMAPLRNAEELRTATFKASQVPTQEALAVKELALKRSTLDNQQKAAADLAEDQRLASLTANAAQKYQSENLAGRLKLGSLAKTLGFPVDASGAPGALTPVQEDMLNKAADASGLPRTSDLFTGDTKKGAAFLTSLVDQGFSPEAVLRNKDKIDATFTTTGLSVAKGNDKAAIDLKRANADVVQAEEDASNWYAPNNPTVVKNFKELMDQVPGLIDKTTGYNAQEDVPAMRDFIYKMSTVGLEVSPGKFLTPSMQDMLHAISTADGGIFTDKKRADNAEALLKKNLSTSRVTTLLEKAEASKKANRDRAVREIINPTPQPKK